MNEWLSDFPLLQTENSNGKKIIYLDSSATTQKPRQVLEAVDSYYRSINANPHRGSYDISISATALLDETRKKVKKFVNLSEDSEVIFTKNATESLNLIAYSYGLHFIEPGDEILISVMEHHSNLVPWQMVATAKQAKLTFLYPDEFGILSIEEVKKKLTDKTKLLCIGHVSNVTGQIVLLDEIIQLAHQNNTIVVVDGTQAAPHLALDLTKTDPDFYVFSGHKLLAPMGIGLLCGKKELLKKMPPFLSGGDMIEYVEEQATTFAPIPEKFEAGTQNLGSIAGLSAALDYLESAGWKRIQEHEASLTSYLLETLSDIPYINIIGSPSDKNRIGVVPFTVEGVHPHDVATILNQDGIAIRAGNHCAQPLHKYLKVPATCRASLYLYNTKDDILKLGESLKGVRRWLGYGS